MNILSAVSLLIALAPHVASLNRLEAFYAALLEGKYTLSDEKSRQQRQHELDFVSNSARKKLEVHANVLGMHGDNTMKNKEGDITSGIQPIFDQIAIENLTGTIQDFLEIRDNELNLTADEKNDTDTRDIKTKFAAFDAATVGSKYAHMLLLTGLKYRQPFVTLYGLAYIVDFSKMKSPEMSKLIEDYIENFYSLTSSALPLTRQVTVTDDHKVTLLKYYLAKSERVQCPNPTNEPLKCTLLRGFNMATNHIQDYGRLKQAWNLALDNLADP